MPCSGITRAKRALVVVLRALAIAYGLLPNVCRESSDDELTKEIRRVARKVHPDKGGADEDAKRLNSARDDWQAAVKKYKDARAAEKFISCLLH